MSKRPFRMDQYKTYTGKPGNPRSWRAAFNETMGTDEARSHVGADTPEGILGVAVGAAWAVVTTAYRTLLLTVHPDRIAFHNLSVEVAIQRTKRLIAAYTLLKARYNR